MTKKALKTIKRSRDNAHIWAMLCHLSGLAGSILLPVLGTVLLPLLIWALKKHTSPLVAANGRSIINFILSLWLYTAFFFVGSIILCTCIAPAIFSAYNALGQEALQNYFVASGSLFLLGMGITFVLGMIFWFFQWALMLYASIKALNGEVYEYPLTIRFLK